MNRIIKRIVNDFNIKKEAEELGVSVWRTPSVLFVLMGLVIIIAMTAIFYIARNQLSGEILVLTETIMIVVIFTIGNFIIKSIEEVAKANKLKSEFISIASHQLKTPLTEINWEIEYMLSEEHGKLSKKQVEMIKTIRRSSMKMSKLTNDLLDVVRIEQGRFVLNKDKVNMIKVIEEVVESNKILAQSNHISIEVVKPEFTPEVIVDEKKIIVVIDNLVTNAIKYIRKKGQVRISVEKNKNSITVCVKDNGIGIPRTQHSVIFQKFFRSGNAARYQTEGNGLGLYIAKNIVNQSGGKIWFKSTEGIGSTFCFTLPIANNLN